VPPEGRGEAPRPCGLSLGIKEMAIPGMPTILKCIQCGTDVKKKEVIVGNAEEIDDKSCVCSMCLPRWRELNARRYGQPPITENENFIALIQAATEDRSIRTKIVAIAGLDPFNRESLINTTIQTLNLRRAPSELIDAISALKDDDIAKKVIEILK